MILRISARILIVSSVVAGAIAIMQFQDIQQKSQAAKHVTDKSLAQLYLLDTQIINYDTNGLPEQVLNSPTSVQRLDSNLAEILKPTILLFRDGQLSWTINADNGKLNPATNDITFENNVKLIETSSDTQLRTDNLSYDTIQRIALSTSNVDVVSKHATISANRLEFKINEGTYKLSNRVTANYANQQ